MTITFLHGDSLAILPTLAAESVQTIVTSPPYYGLRKYSSDPREIGGESAPDCLAWAQRPIIGMEEIIDEDGVTYDRPTYGPPAPPCGTCYVCAMRAVFRALWRVLRADGTVWLNLGDSYSGAGTDGGIKSKDGSAKRTGRMFKSTHSPTGIPDKNLIMIPARIALALQSDGWIVRSDIVWSKPNCMPESVTDRPTRAHEYVYLLAKQARYYYDATAISEPITEDRPIDSWEKRKSAGAGSGSMETGHNTSLAKGAGFSHTLGNGVTRNRRTVWQIATQPYSGAGDCEECRGTGVDWGASQSVWGVRMTDAEHKAFCKANPCPACDGSKKDGTDHFATMPEALIAPCILAGSSAQACETCGAAWGRVVEREKAPYTPDNSVYLTENRQSSKGKTRHQSGGMPVDTVTTLGSAPRCQCAVNTGAARSIVLDPFGGSGTVARVAERFQRDAILIDLNADYIDLQAQRTDGVQVELFVS